MVLDDEVILGKEEHHALSPNDNTDGALNWLRVVSSIPVSKNNIKETIQKILHVLEKYGFPKLKNSKSSITFNI